MPLTVTAGRDAATAIIILKAVVRKEITCVIMIM